MAQKFNKGDLVRVADDLGPSMRHFTASIDAIVIGSYFDQYGGADDHDRVNESYTLYLKGRGEVSWYHENQLTLIARKQNDTLDLWRRKSAEECSQKSDLDWIFANGPDVLKATHGASIQALASCFGLDNLWGSHGEGFVYYANASHTMQMAEPYLLAKDKAGWLEFCKNNRIVADQEIPVKGESE
jgi:hypothetical protein